MPTSILKIILDSWITVSYMFNFFFNCVRDSISVAQL